MTAFPLPVLDEARCSGCGRCVVVCPAGCLEPTAAVVWLPRPGDCVRCGACAMVCPDAAVKVVNGHEPEA